MANTTNEVQGASAVDEADELIPLSYLSQYGYCPRRCGLIAVDGLWNENEFTAEGRSAHSRTHTPRVEKRGSLISLFEFSVFSRTLGVTGLCDCVELYASAGGVPMTYGHELYTLYPVEYKHGVVRDEHEYHLQLCAQAMCLEEQYHTSIPKGAIFFIDAHRRDEIDLTEEMRSEVRALSTVIHHMIRDGIVPPAEPSVRCKKCSMSDLCSPSVRRKADAYLNTLWKTAGELPDDEEQEDEE